MRKFVLITACLALFTVDVAARGGPVFYPAEGQSASRQDRDLRHCEDWAYNRTGFDPYDRPPPRREHRDTRSDEFGRDVFGGAAQGAFLGVIGGAIAGDVGKGAAIGAGVGATSGLIRNSQRRRGGYRRDSYELRQYREDRKRYNHALRACMTGRGYSAG